MPVVRHSLALSALFISISGATVFACSTFSEADTPTSETDGGGGDAVADEASADGAVLPTPPEAGADAGHDPSRYYVFVTSIKTTGFFGVNKADTACNAAAKVGGLPGSYAAWLETSALPAKGRLTNPDVTYFTTHDDLAFGAVGPSAAGLPTTKLAFNELGATLDSGEIVWTGTPDPDTGIVTPATCNDWDTAGSAAFGYYGDPTSTTGSWTSASTKPCASQAHYYCFRTN